MREYLTRHIECPHCAQQVSIDIDASNGDQDYYEDCKHCCNPIHLRLIRDEQHDKLQLYVDGDDEQLF